jgi:nucleoid-associated protein YgaU
MPHEFRWESFMLNTNAIIAALLGVVVVGGVGAYVYLENADPTDLISKASLVTEQTSSGKSNSVLSAAKRPASEGEEVAALDKDAGTASPTANWIVPAFDLLRVEPDGSTVVAGRAQPNTSIKLMNGADVIIEEKVGSSGDFAMILDKPLAAGDYELTLAVEDENGNVRTSVEVAIVSVPEDASGQLLAMVNKPGEASRILAQPEATKPVEMAAVEPVKEMEKAVEAVDTAVDAAADVVTDVAADVETGVKSLVEQKVDAVADLASTEIAAAGEMVKDAVKATENAGATVLDKMDEAVAPVKELAADVKTDVETSVEMASNSKAVADTKEIAAEIMKNDDQPLAVDVVKEEMVKTQEVASLSPEVDDTPKLKTPETNVRIEAVEVEGDKLFIAGIGTKGYQVRVFADDKEVGLTSVNGQGRFLLEAIEPLDVGKHQITAALENKTTKQVMLRAIVPFNRPEGKALAAVASSKPAAAPNVEPVTDIVKSETEMAKAELDVMKPVGDAVDAAVDAAGAVTDVAVANVDAAVEKVETAVVAVTEATSEMVKTETAAEGAVRKTMMAEAATEEAAAVEVVADEAMADTKDIAMAAAAEKPEMVETAETMIKPNLGPNTGSTNTEVALATTETAQPSVQSDEPKTIVQEQLQPSASQSVIIRRGDTLWQIARRTYGAGVRYTTIYLANQEQIINPDMIAPGQIFAIPEDALENAEELHRKRLSQK